MSAPTEVSAIVRLRDGSGRYVAVSNETGVWVCGGGTDPRRLGAAAWAPLAVPALPEDPEGAAVADDDTVWICGSHSNLDVDREKLNRYTPDLRLLMQSHSVSMLIRANPSWAFLRPLLGVLNIEGIAFARGALLIGLRAPLIDGKAVVLRIGAPNAKLFPATRNDLTYYLVDLGGLGVRDLATHPSGSPVYISAGGSVDGKAQFHLRAVDPVTLQLLAYNIALPKGPHWEAVLPLEGKIIMLADEDASLPTAEVTG